jgi:triacylglycerol lipase
VDEPATQCPVLLVHGLWDSRSRIEPLAEGLRARGIEDVHSFDLTSASGRTALPVLARQIEAEVQRLSARSGCERVDIVGFSMGALATHYYLQRFAGQRRVRRFVSISGPHAGTWTAYALPFEGVRQMRPGSAFLRELASVDPPFAEVEVHCIYTPLDTMIVPAKSSIVPGARSVTSVPVLLHRWMMRDRRVLDVVARILLGG